MNRQWSLNLGLLVLVALLAGLVIFRPGLDKPRPTPVSQINRDAVESITIERPATPAIVLQKQDGHWRLVAPLKARASSFVVNNLLAISGAASLKQLPYDANRDADQFGLRNPRLVIRYNKDELVFGDTSPLNQQQYLLHGQQLHLVSGNLSLSVPHQAGQFLDRRLLESDDTPVAIDFGHGQKLQLVNGTWQLDPANDKLTTDSLLRMVNEWKYASALNIDVADNARAADSVRIHYADGRQVEIGIVSRKPELILLRNDEGLQYHFDTGAAGRLFPPTR